MSLFNQTNRKSQVADRCQHLKLQFLKHKATRNTTDSTLSWMGMLHYIVAQCYEFSLTVGGTHLYTVHCVGVGGRTYLLGVQNLYIGTTHM